MVALPFANPNIPTPETFSGFGPAPMPVGPPPTVEDQADGGVIVSFPTPEDLQAQEPPPDFNENLAEYLSDSELSTVVQELLDGIDADDRSRTEWVSNYSKGIDLLGLKIEDKAAGTPRQKTSSVRHPILTWACSKFQAQARGELLPAAGPIKVENTGDANKLEDDAADDLERDLNHYLTVTATEYYPDTDRGMFYLAFGGTIFKKVYHCPLRRRPVSECVYLPDLIVSNDATDLANATRITHKIEMTKYDVARMMKYGHYVDVNLTQPSGLTPNIIKQAEARQTGVKATPERPQDYLRTIYECYTALDLSDTSVAEDNIDDDTPLPYCITIDRESRRILKLVRNWREGDELYRKRQTFVKYGLIPGMGFLDLGFLHLIGNHAKALTAMLRMMMDAAMFANFPGGVRAKGVRLTTNEINPGPGEFLEIETGGLPIDQIIMKLPFSGPTAEIFQLYQEMQSEAQQMVGVSDIEVGEGRADVPVGTIMAMVEQQSTVLMAIHKRLHESQQSEFILLKERLSENPEALLRGRENVTHAWTEDDLRSANLVPATDPNVPSHVHRMMQNEFIHSLASENPAAFKQREVYERILKAASISSPDTLLSDSLTDDGAQGGQQGQEQDPSQTDMAAATAAQAQADMADVQRKAAQDTQTNQQKIADLQTRLREKALEVTESEKDRQSRERIAAMNDETQIIVKGLAQLGQPASPDPVNDERFGP